MSNFQVLACAHFCPVQYQLDSDPETLHRALAIFEPHGEAWGAAEVRTLLAHWHLNHDELEAAAAHASQAMEAYGRLGDRVNFTVAQLALAKTHIDRGAYDEALPILNSALGTTRDTRHTWCEATAHRHLGLLMLGKDDAAQALSHLDAAVEVMRAAGQQLPMALALEVNPKAHARLGEGVVAQTCGQEAYEILAQMRPQSAQALQRWLSTLDGAC